MVEVGEAKKGTYLLNFSGGWLCSDTIELHWVYGKLTRFHDHSKGFDFRDIKLTLLKFQIEVELCHMPEDLTGSFGMSFWVQGGDEEVIYIDDKPSFSNHVLEGIIHESLKCSRGVTKAKEHSGGFKESFVDDEGCLPLVTIFDADIIIPSMNIKFGEVVSIL